MPSRSIAVVLACLSPLLLAGGANAQLSNGDKAKDAHLTAAAMICDRGAAAPLDPRATSAPVPFLELFPRDLNTQKLRSLVAACDEAQAGMPQEQRFLLQLLRTRMALDEGDVDQLAPELRRLARAGGAEARYLLFMLFRTYRNRGDDVAVGVERAEALAALESAAAAGHQPALMELADQYRRGPLLRRDPVRAVQTLRAAAEAPRQGTHPGASEAETRAAASLLASTLVLANDGFDAETQQAAFASVDRATSGGTAGEGAQRLAFIEALRHGRGVAKDPARAKELLEAQVSAGDAYAVPALARMLAAGEAGQADPKRALALLSDDRQRNVPDCAMALADMLLDGKTVGRQPVAAIRTLLRSSDPDASIRLAGLLVDYRPSIDKPKEVVGALIDAAAVGHPGAAMALARLKLSDGQFRDVDGARVILKPLADAGDEAALWLYAESQYEHLDQGPEPPRRRAAGLADDGLKQLVESGVERKRPEAFLLAAKLLRRGVLYEQDDAAATRALANAAALGDVEAMTLLGDAYAEGLGVAKSPHERLRWWREAAARGSLDARLRLARAFPGDAADRLMTLREGVTERVALFNDGVGRAQPGGFVADKEVVAAFADAFTGGRAAEAGPTAMAAAVMDGFREAPAGLEDNALAVFSRALPEAIRVAIETKLKADGFYHGETTGGFGAEARKALAAWVDAAGPLGDAAPPAPPTSPSLVPPETVVRLRDWAFGEAERAKTRDDRLEVIRSLSALARYGDPPARWALVRNYHQSDLVRDTAGVDEIARYALDLMASRPAGIERLDAELAADLAEIARRGEMQVFADAIIIALRDDARLQDPLTLGAVMGQLGAAPGGCASVLEAARKAGVRELGADGCADEQRAELISFARQQGPAGVDRAAREAAAPEIVALSERIAEPKAAATPRAERQRAGPQRQKRRPGNQRRRDRR